VGDLGKLLMVAGGILLVFGLLLVLAGRTQLPLGRLPGDVVYRGKNSVIYFPIVTSIVLSVVLSLVFYLIARLRG
jgi:hypothetical protein